MERLLSGRPVPKPTFGHIRLTTNKEKKLKQLKTVIILAAAILSICACANASILGSTAYSCSDLFISVPTGSYMGGFDVLPNGNYVINDGNTVKEIKQSGECVRTIYTYGTPQMASFVRCNNGTIYFADSSYENSMVHSVAIAGGPVADIAQVYGNYDMAFYGDQSYIVNNGSVSLLNTNGSTTNVATINGVWSGPVAVDASGNLFFAPSAYPAASTLYEWSAAKVQSALGGQTLGAADADLTKVLGGAAGMTFDNQGRLIFSNNSGGQSRIERWDGTSIVELAHYTLTDATSPSVTFLHYDNATGDIYAGLNYYTGDSANPYANNFNYISKLAPVPEPSCALALGSLIGLVGSAGLLRRRSK